MRIILILTTFLFWSCDKRVCGCDGDIDFSERPLDLNISIPNAVNENCSAYIIAIHSKDELDISTQKFSFTKGDIDFLKNRELADFLVNEEFFTAIPEEFSSYQYTLEFPLDLFIDTNGELIKRELDFDISLVSSVGETIQVSGSTYFYRCEDIDGEFDENDCFWPSQVLTTEFLDPNCRC